MAVSTFDLFKIGIGPSSSHTVGPMRAAFTFARRQRSAGRLGDVHWVTAELYGSLGHTGRGHGTDKAVILGLLGEVPDRVDPDAVPGLLAGVEAEGELMLLGSHPIEFRAKKHLTFHKRAKLPHHSNGMRFIAFGADQKVLDQQDYYSVGGGFVVNEDEAAADRIVPDETPLPHPFRTGEELLSRSRQTGKTIAEMMLENERCWRSDDEIRGGLTHLWEAMQACVRRGVRSEGELPGGLKVKRRAPAMHRMLNDRPEASMQDPLSVLDWVNLYALAVNEENAAGGRVVTAPTNGAAGIIPAVLHYYDRFVPGATEAGVFRFLLTSAPEIDAFSL